MKKLFFSFLAFTGTMFSLNAQSLTQINGEMDFQNKPVEFQGKLFFKTTTLANGEGLYYTDGSGNLVFVKSLVGEISDEFVEAGGKLFFVFDDGSHGQELWVTDGTGAGTNLVKDINPGFGDGVYFHSASYTCSYNGSQRPFADRRNVFQNKFYFIANDGTHGNELWVTDGTENGTQLVYDIAPGSGNGVCGVTFAEFQNKLYFQGHSSGDDSTNEIWRTDGNGNTEITPVQYGSLFTIFTVMNVLVSEVDEISHTFSYPNSYTYSYTNGDSLYSLLSIDWGTVIKDDNGVPLVYNSYPFICDKFHPDSFYISRVGVVGANHLSDFKILNDKLFFISQEGTGAEGYDYFLYAAEIDTLSATAPTRLVRVYTMGNGLSELNGKLLFTGQDNYGAEPWITDGTVAGTHRIKDIAVGSGGVNGDSYSNIHYVLYNGKLYFTVDGGSPNNFWRTDGTETGTYKVAAHLPVVSFYWNIIYNNCLYFNTWTPDEDTENIWRLCGDASAIENVVAENAINVFPNPFTNKITIEPNIPYRLFDLLGREADKENLQALPAGTYILKTEYGATRVTKM